MCARARGCIHGDQSPVTGEWSPRLGSHRLPSKSGPGPPRALPCRGGGRGSPRLSRPGLPDPRERAPFWSLGPGSVPASAVAAQGPRAAGTQESGCSGRPEPSEPPPRRFDRCWWGTAPRLLSNTWPDFQRREEECARLGSWGRKEGRKTRPKTKQNNHPNLLPALAFANTESPKGTLCHRDRVTLRPASLAAPFTRGLPTACLSVDELTLCALKPPPEKPQARLQAPVSQAPLTPSAQALPGFPRSRLCAGLGSGGLCASVSCAGLAGETGIWRDEDRISFFMWAR